MKYILSLPLRGQLLLGFIGVALIPLIAALLFVIHAYSFSFQREAQSKGRQQIVKVEQRFEAFLDASDSLLKTVSKNSKTAESLIDRINDEYQKELYINLYRESASLPAHAQIDIYDAGGLLKFSTCIETAAKRLPVYWGVLAGVRRNENDNFYVSRSIADINSDILLQMACAVYNKDGARLGYIVMSLDREDFNTLFLGCCDENDTIFITDTNLKTIYSSDAGESYENIEGLRESIRKEKDFYVMKTDKSEKYILILKKPAVLSGFMRSRMLKISIIISFICFVLCFLVAMLMGKWFSAPVKQLNEAMELVKKGDLSIQVETNQKNELGVLAENFNLMTKDLDFYVKSIILRQKELKDTQIKLFQTQLNPHFFNNTLDSIKWTARLHKLDDISLMSENLAYILQYGIGSKQLVPLYKELEMIDSYILIQKIRFQGSFKFEMEVPDELKDCMVPKLILQPIVENAIIHGLRDRECGNISVWADRIGESIHISVNDDGVGVSQEVVDWLMDEKGTQRDGHMGLYNVNRIIKLYYGEEYGLYAAVEKEIGTTFTIILPIRKGNADDNSIDR